MVENFSALIFASLIVKYYELIVSIMGGMILNRIEPLLFLSKDQKNEY